MNNTAETPRVTDSHIPPAVPKPQTLTRRIGNTTYRVRVHFSKTSKETMNDKILRMIKNGAGGKGGGIMKKPFTSPPFRSIMMLL